MPGKFNKTAVYTLNDSKMNISCHQFFFCKFRKKLSPKTKKKKEHKTNVKTFHFLKIFIARENA